jgi:phage terminase small subunit
MKRTRKEQAPLTPKQVKFCANYVATSNGAQSAIAAGYSPGSATIQAVHMLRRKDIQEEIKRLNDEGNSAAIATAKERAEFWTKIMLDEEQSMKDRLRASELLGKSGGDFLERREITGPDGSPLVAPDIHVHFTDGTQEG